MKPCYITTYFLEGPCYVNVNAVTRYESEGPQRCLLYFENGTRLTLGEGCDAFEMKRERCKDKTSHDYPVFPKSVPQV
jgi:hypothetical protein